MYFNSWFLCGRSLLSTVSALPVKAGKRQFLEKNNSNVQCSSYGPFAQSKLSESLRTKGEH